MRLIDADLLKGQMESVCMGIMAGTDSYGAPLKTIDNAPTVDPVKHGHWVEVQRIHEKDHTAICECSLCGDTVWVYDGQRAWNYCPNCGAKMDEVEE